MIDPFGTISSRAFNAQHTRGALMLTFPVYTHVVRENFAGKFTYNFLASCNQENRATNCRNLYKKLLKFPKFLNFKYKPEVKMLSAEISVDITFKFYLFYFFLFFILNCKRNYYQT